MSKVEELVKKLCPKGVDRVRLDSILDYEQPTRYIVSSTEYDKKYKIPVLTAGKCFILGYTNEENGIYEASPQKPTIVFDDFTTGFHWVDFDFKVKSSAIKMLKLKKTMSKNDFRYIYMAMKAINFIPRDHVRHWISIYSKFDIPLPPPDVQHEIVSVLDTFTMHIEKMRKEVELRKKQMEYYREALIFSDKNTCRLSTICIFPKEKIASSEVDMSNYVSVENLLKDKGGKTSASETPHEGRYYKYLPEDILLGNIRPYLKKIWYADTIGGTNGDVVVIRAKKETGIIPKFLFYAISSDLFFVYYGATANNGKMPRGNKKKLADFSFPVPPSSVQRSIVSILDTFETYISKLEQLIALHEKQYAYYREKLLTFD